MKSFPYRSALASETNATESEAIVPVDVPHEDKVEQEAQSDEPKPYTKVVVLSAVQESPCITDGGDKLHFQSVKNKQVQSSLT